MASETETVGNAAAMHAALCEIANRPECQDCEGEKDNKLCDACYRETIFSDIVKLARAALSLPPRNCDVGTANEQVNRMRQFCAKQKRNGIINCGYCPIKHQYERDCTLAWAQMPYEAEEGGER